MRNIRWITKAGLLILHDVSIREHGGSRGIRDEGLLESALARPRNIALYEEHVSLWRLAAAYAFGITKNHPFIDGNKRAAFLAMNLFLEKNRCSLTAGEAGATLTVLKLAASEMTEEDLAAWIKSHLTNGGDVGTVLISGVHAKPREIPD